MEGAIWTRYIYNPFILLAVLQGTDMKNSWTEAQY